MDETKIESIEKNTESTTIQSKTIQSTAFVPIVHQFFTEVKTYDESVTFLKKLMHHKVYDYSLSPSRKIFYALVVYKFGKELDFSDELQNKARQVILFVLQNQIEDKGFHEKRRKIFREYILELDKFKTEDFKNYMYELGVQYNQLVEMRERLFDHPEWIESIQSLMDKILDQVIFVKGDVVFQQCLETLGKLKKEIIKEHLVNAYWDMMLEELQEKKYDMMMKNYLFIKNILLEMRDDQDTKEILDETYIQQLLQNDLFNEKTLLSQVDFIFDKIKKYGIPIYDKIIDKSKNNIIKEIQEKGVCSETVVLVFKKTIPILQNYIEIIRIYRKQIKKSKEVKETQEI